jgi:hypothetical protein
MISSIARCARLFLCYANTMAFNHYAKMKHILDQQPPGWYIKRINRPTTAQTFRGELRHFDYYYRIYDSDAQPIKYCKFQQIDRLSAILQIPVGELPVID